VCPACVEYVTEQLSQVHLHLMGDIRGVVTHPAPCPSTHPQPWEGRICWILTVADTPVQYPLWQRNWGPWKGRICSRLHRTSSQDLHKHMHGASSCALIPPLGLGGQITGFYFVLPRSKFTPALPSTKPFCIWYYENSNSFLSWGVLLTSRLSNWNHGLLVTWILPSAALSWCPWSRPSTSELVCSLMKWG
jgi:hypothetical protein